MATNANYQRTFKLGLVFSVLGLANTTFLLFGLAFMAVGAGGLLYARWTAK